MIGSAWLALLSALVLSQPGSAHPSFDMPRPSGPYAIGRVSYDWVDTSRAEILSKVPNTHREIVVDVWYPAPSPQPGTRTAPYFPNAGRIDQSLYAWAVQRNMGNLWPMIASGRVHSHAYENAPFVAGKKRFPLLIFSPAIGGEPYTYTNQIEELVSHGFIVAAVNHTYEVSAVVFPDGRIVPFSEENFQRSRVEGTEDIANERQWENERLDVWAADMRFTLDQITRLDTAPQAKAPFAGRVDLTRVGVFGHSFGGIAVGRACELDRRFRACLNQDGTGDDGPLQHYAGGRPPTQPFLFLRSPRMSPPTDEQLKAMQMTRNEFEKDQAEALALLDKDLHDCSGGAYQIWIETPGFRHDSFGDLNLLRAGGDREETARVLRSLHVVESYSLAFFDKYLNGTRDTLLDREPSKDSAVKIQRYAR